MIDRIGVKGFFDVDYPILDVRSPGEYTAAHIPGAYNLPLFTDDERKVIGTLYNYQGQQDAIKKGLEYFGVRMRGMVEATERIVKEHGPNSGNNVLIHCWRGGMRSAGVAWLLDLYGFKVYVIDGGYKAFRSWVLAQFELPYNLSILGGYTGSGKTEILKELQKGEAAVIDLEGIAGHKGSAFGGIGIPAQSSQEMFENKLAIELRNISARHPGKPIWAEDESRRIGAVNIPGTFWETMSSAPLYFLELPFECRLSHIADSYGKLNKADLIAATLRIQKRLGRLNAKNAIAYLENENYIGAFSILLRYYDKCYIKSVQERKNIFRITAAQVDANINGNLIARQTITS